MRTPVRAGVGGVVLGLGRWNLGAEEVAIGERGAGVEVGAWGGGAGSSRYCRFFPSTQSTSHPTWPLESDQSVPRWIPNLDAKKSLLTVLEQHQIDRPNVFFLQDLCVLEFNSPM